MKYRQKGNQYIYHNQYVEREIILKR